MSIPIEIKADRPRISVVLPAWNAAEWIARAIESALRQSLPPYEVLVVDDGSSDGTLAVAGGFGPPVRTIKRPHRGQSAATNAGVVEATGDFVAILHADDEWLPEKSKTQLAALAPNPAAGIAYCDLDLVAPDGSPKGRFLEDKPFAGEGNVLEALISQHFVVPSATLIRRELFQRHGLRFAEDLRVAADYDFWLKAARIYEFVRVDQPLARRTVRSETVVRRSEETHLDHVTLFRRLRNDLKADEHVPRRILRTLDRRLASCERRLALDRYSAGRYRASQDLLGASWRRHPSLRTTGMLLAVAVGPAGRGLAPWVRRWGDGGDARSGKGRS